MRYIKIISRTVLFTCLFVIALFSTFYTFSGVSAAMIHHWVLESNSNKMDEQQLEVRDNQYKLIGLQEKSITKENKEEAITVSQNNTLENMIDWSQYPSETVIATGYTAGYESTGKREGHPAYGITFSGVEVKRDLYSTIAADPTVFPIGSVLFIPGYGYGVVADTGSAIKGNKIDLYYETVQDVYDKWGKKEVEVYVVERGDGTLTEDQLILLNENEAVQVFRDQID